MINSFVGPSLLIGDLNEVVDYSEKLGGRPIWKKQLFLKSFLNNLDWKDRMECHQLRRSLFNTTKALQKWNREHFGFAQNQIYILETELANVTDREEARQGKIRQELIIQRARLDLILRQKSRETWLKDRDKNSKFFHMSLTVRRHRNRILAIKNGHEWVHDPSGISKYFMDNFN